jgi:hypothetical protein
LRAQDIGRYEFGVPSPAKRTVILKRDDNCRRNGR